MALPLLEDALKVQEATQDPDWLAITRFCLGRALWETGGDRARARGLVMAAMGHASSLMARDLDAKGWLVRHP